MIMKKLSILTLVLGFTFTINVASANSIDNSNTKATDPQTEQKSTKIQKEKPTKYDFSLFKFLTPSSINQKKDSLSSPVKQPGDKSKDETVYENPLAFFKFSYAS
jgi:hypothetical protein